MVFDFYDIFLSLLFQLKTNRSLIKSITRSKKLYNIRFIISFTVFNKGIRFCCKKINFLNLKTVYFLMFNECCNNCKYYLWIYFIWKLAYLKFDKKLTKRISEYFIYYIYYADVSIIANIMFRIILLLWLNFFLHNCLLCWIIFSIRKIIKSIKIIKLRLTIFVTITGINISQ